MSTLLYLSHALRRHRPRKIPGRRFLRRSAVNLLIREDDEQGLMLFMIQRATRKRDRWSGQMAFPGGLMDPTDDTIRAAALRELHEEVGISMNDGVRPLGRLSDLLTQSHRGLRPMVITPFVYGVDAVPAIEHNYEVADSLWIPLSFFFDKRNRRMIKWCRRGQQARLPCYYYREKQIWGLSLSMLDELLEVLKPYIGLAKYDAINYELTTKVIR